MSCYRTDPYRYYLKAKRLKEEKSTHNEIMESLGVKSRNYLSYLLNIGSLDPAIQGYLKKGAVPEWKELRLMISSSKKAKEVTLEQFEAVLGISRLEVADKKTLHQSMVVDGAKVIHLHQDAPNQTKLHAKQKNIEIPKTLGSKGDEVFRAEQEILEAKNGETLGGQCTKENGAPDENATAKTSETLGGQCTTLHQTGENCASAPNAPDAPDAPDAPPSAAPNAPKKTYREIIFSKIDGAIRETLEEVSFSLSKASIFIKLTALALVTMTVGNAIYFENYFEIPYFVLVDLLFIYVWRHSPSKGIWALRIGLAAFVIAASSAAPIKSLSTAYAEYEEKKEGVKVGDNLVSSEEKQRRHDIAEKRLVNLEKSRASLEMGTHPLQIKLASLLGKEQSWIKEKKELGFPNPLRIRKGQAHREYVGNDIENTKKAIASLSYDKRIGEARKELAEVTKLELTGYSEKERALALSHWHHTRSSQGVPLLLRMILVAAIIILSIEAQGASASQRNLEYANA